MNCILGVDIGTTNVKALAFHPESGEIVAHASAPLTTLNPQPGYAEQDPEEVWKKLTDVLEEVCREVGQQQGTVEAVGFSAAMHSILAVDDHGKPLTNAILWSDNRSEKQADALRQEQADLGKTIYQQTGTPLHPMIPLCKLAWFRENDLRLLRRATGWLSIKEYIWHKLTGQYQVDYSIATATGLFDSQQKAWYPVALDYAGIRPEQLSEPVPTTHASRLNYPDLPQTVTDCLTGATLYIGASDGCLANLGAGAIGAGITTITIGTSGAIRRTVQRPLRDEHGRLFSYILNVDDKTDKNYFVVGGPTNNGANVLQWLSEKLMLAETDAVLAEAQTVPAGSDDLLFLPYLQGERAPLWDAGVRGSYLNVDWQHGRAHFVRAALEGVLFNLLRTERILSRHTGPTQVIHANGGFAQSEFWVQMMADIFGVPVRLNESNESGSIGAILLTMKATGRVTSLGEAMRYVGFGQTFEPDAECHRRYQQVYQRFEKALP
ncbi:gluconokinase [Larkinella arboricola]|uniref:Gluconokinase n=1 Tax=Larkinella arboricola TaxID=643671 RepID=A0A327WW07_LARAB|nr:gluconokinase [Larkinella arboricola]RAJ97497.1 gluconokinase [Larkinella arboricola]